MKMMRLRSSYALIVLLLAIATSGFAVAQTAPATEKPEAAKVIVPAQVAPPKAAEKSPPPEASVSQLGWLAGCWQANAQARGETLTEFWLKPTGGAMLGMGQTIKGERSTASEAMRVYDEGKSIKLWMKPAGRAEMTFDVETIGAKSVQFATAEKDVTTKVSYAATTDGALDVTFRIEKEGSRRGADFTFKRVDCESFVPAK
jgi:Domain of unknown function (DUF6265)